MVFQRSERIYIHVVQRFLQGQLPVEDFVRDFMQLWRDDRDAEWKSLERSSIASIQYGDFSRALDQAFTACDCFSHEPSTEFEISESQLRHEIQGLFGNALGEAHAL